MFPNIFRALATHQNALIQQIYRPRTVAQGKRRTRDIISRDVEGCVYYNSPKSIAWGHVQVGGGGDIAFLE